MSMLAYYYGSENISWLGAKYRELSAEINGIRNLVIKLIEIYRMIEGNEEIKKMIIQELEKNGRSDLAKIILSIL